MLHSSTSTIQKASSEKAKAFPLGDTGGDQVVRVLELGFSCRGVGESGGLESGSPERGLREVLRETWSLE